ncbi:acyl-CoA thioester hydrolase, YbgC/YbaW family [Fusobacterium necrophorum subsp. funduliforme ATCC 51357]|uniref:Esterase n=1 Tax=Fusobacterium necrophorum subsp. funduliforme TaxID=143387 RepID=A0A161PPR6_9FUSO|nr:thioesterase family protein [Fusobacterium necrophorum]AYV93342.1 acyl-CoA thioesterase [Fusobacterium necrophorum subsp. funduliforme]EIJ68424.1 acyl-CoA thioester hydrolase, YbgC/YbaW family [Fusobacterium necrophorum subsp. funduliforme ATCC 51357]KAB0554484.1 acyl-CoA thioesterase [Fusobacterium necrophorum subsp. funduliforme]KYL00799.1 esterase [Fusobacterium necrophorum subsp. funduliforme]KYM46813.1 esterase [Fusobacterium necrophorum subsp. funduliforme]
MFQVIYKIQKEDMNVGNHVGNEKSLVFFEKVRKQWLESHGYTELCLGEGVGLIQKSASVEYKKQLFLEDAITIGISKIEVEKLFFTFFYQICNETGELCMEGSTKMLAYDYQSQKVKKIPKDFLNTIKEYNRG